jgi:hypothetical protein
MARDYEFALLFGYRNSDNRNRDRMRFIIAATTEGVEGGAVQRGHHRADPDANNTGHNGQTSGKGGRAAQAGDTIAGRDHNTGSAAENNDRTAASTSTAENDAAATTKNDDGTATGTAATEENNAAGAARLLSAHEWRQLLRTG